MKPIDKMTLGELAAFVDTNLKQKGINVVLSGGACVSIYSGNLYVSKDLDFVEQFRLNSKEVSEAMTELGFNLRGRYFYHPQTPYFVEFIPGPPAIGRDPIEAIHEIKMETGTVRIISPTDSVKDRLAAYYHWGDRQALQQAILVARSTTINLASVETWSRREEKHTEFEDFLRNLNSND